MLERTENIITEDKNGENIQKLETVDVILMHCNVVIQQASNVLFTFVPTQQFGKLINIAPYTLTISKTTNLTNY